MKADKILSDKGIEYEIVEHDRPVKGCSEAADQRGIETSQIVKSLIVRKGEQLFHVCVPGDREFSEKKFGEARLVDPEKSKEITGFESGTVHPLSSDLKHFIDERVFEHETISFTTGSPLKGVLLDSDNFKEVLRQSGFEFEIEDIVVTEDQDIQELKETGVSEEEASFIANKGYRSILNSLTKDYPVDEVVVAVRKLHREDVEFGKEQVKNLVKRSENENHMHKLAIKLAENGELPDTEDDFELENTVQSIIKDNPEAIEDFKQGKDSALNYLIGQIMEKTNGRADAGKARKLIEEEV